MKNKLQICIHNALLSLFNNDSFDAKEKAELVHTVLESQAGLDEMIKGGVLTEPDCERIEADINLFLDATNGRTTEQKIMACSILMLLFGVDLAAEIKQVAKGGKPPTSDSTGDTAPQPAEPTPAKAGGKPQSTVDRLLASRDKYGDEQVLVVTRAWLLHVFGLEDEQPLPQGFMTAGRNSLDAILEEAHFMPRHLMEEDVTSKQLIPYLVVVDENNQVLTYLRGKAGMEDRLHAKLSFGFGGHINPVDGAPLDDPNNRPGKLFNPGLTVERCIERELEEEIGIKLDMASMKPKLVGYVNNDADAVGQVHLGLVYLIAVDNSQADMTKAEQAVVEPRWRNTKGLLTSGVNHHRLEEWSRLIVEPLFGSRNRYTLEPSLGELRQRAVEDGPVPNDDDLDEPSHASL